MLKSTFWFALFSPHLIPDPSQRSPSAAQCLLTFLEGMLPHFPSKQSCPYVPKPWCFGFLNQDLGNAHLLESHQQP